jgi:hypothetical protein
MSDRPPAEALPPDHGARMARAWLSLDGLSVGDAFGQRFFYAPSVESLIAARAVPAPPWLYTDDTEMAAPQAWSRRTASAGRRPPGSSAGRAWLAGADLH